MSHIEDYREVCKHRDTEKIKLNKAELDLKGAARQYAECVQKYNSLQKIAHGLEYTVQKLLGEEAAEKMKTLP